MKSNFLAAMCLCFLAGCDGPKAPAQSFHLTVNRDPANNDQRQQTAVTFHAPPKAEVLIEVARPRFDHV